MLQYSLGGMVLTSFLLAVALVLPLLIDSWRLECICASFALRIVLALLNASTLGNYGHQVSGKHVIGRPVS